ncbi:hypothetical protein F5X96DRAFT_645184 [Biscogniauxia mediterranea]|nr:hypothetical protein F5X96DRAFT_645184 [Biscogniauxia mediterranea]
MPHYHCHSHHHHRRYPARADKYSADLPDRRRPPDTRYQVQNSSLSSGRLNRVADAPSGHDVVESWLGGVVAHTPRPPPESPKFRKEAAHSSRRRLPQDTRPLNGECSGRVDSTWRPHRILHMKTSQSPRTLHPIHEEGSKRSKHRRNDSSLISGFENSAKPPKCDFVSASDEREQTSPSTPLGEEHRSSVGDSPPTSHLDELKAFERRPRRKTREDKYDTNKKAGRKHGTSGGEEDGANRRRKRTKRAGKKRKPAVPSKNVMNNFTSDAVMNDRITVQPTFKPGLFDNGRLSKGKPIPDLAFSEMQFLKHQKRDPQPKPLSRHRLRERRRENREVEQVSSFFLPSKKEGKSRDLSNLPRKRERDVMDTNERDGHEQDDIHQRCSGSFELSSPQHNRIYTRQESSSPHNRFHQLPINNDNTSELRRKSSKATTNFTWSSSHPSPQTNMPDLEKGSQFSGSIRTATPELARKSLIATGVYRNTGIYPYDDSTSQQTHHTTHCGVSTDKASLNEKECRVRDQREPSDSPDVRSRVEMALAGENIKALKQRWNTILPPEWRLERDVVSGNSVDTKGHPADDVKKDKCSAIIQDYEPAGSLNSVEPSRAHAHNHDANSSTSQVCSPNHAGNKSSTPLKQGNMECGQIPGSQDRVSQTSREAMPPPPLPIRETQVTDRDIISGTKHPPYTSNIYTAPDNSQDKIQDSLKSIPTQHIAILDDNHDASTFSLGSTTNTEDTDFTLRSGSWIPQTRTPSIVNDGRCTVLSRISTKAPIYVSQLNEKPGTISTSSQLFRPQSNESISQFIARIEREADEKSYSEHYTLPSLETDLDMVPLSSPVTHTETYGHGLVPISTERPEEPQEVPNGLPNVEQEYEESRLSCPLLEDYNTESFVPDRRNIETLELSPPGIQPHEDLDDERLEMSRFWRPNYYSQF